MDQYRRVITPKPPQAIVESEIRVTQQGKIRKYIAYATTLLLVSEMKPHPPSLSLFRVREC